MTIDKAIAKYKNKAEEYKQLAELLEELKDIKSDGFTDDLLNMGFIKGYNKALDDLMGKASECFISDTDWHYLWQLAKQLKAGAGNGTDNQ